MLEVRELRKSYGGRQVLAPVSFSLAAGEALGVYGANGSGKSTLLRLTAQAEAPDGGQVLFEGRDVRGDRDFVRKRLGYVPQEDALFEELTVGQQGELWRAACGLRGRPPEEIWSMLGLESLERKRIGELSGGTRRRVSIALALSSGADVLVMDEATVGLDRAFRDALMEWMEAFLRRGGRALWCSHRVEELERLCGRCLSLSDGRARWGLSPET